MGLRNYSVNEGAVVAASADNISPGYGVCIDASLLGYVTATAANRALTPTGRISGIAIGLGVPNGVVPIVNVGHVDASVVGTLTGTGSYVNVTSTGALQRSSAITSDTIGDYEDDGGVWVYPPYQHGGSFSGNATAIQSIAVSSASGALSHGLVGNGTTLRDRLLKPNLADYLAYYGVAANGTDDCTTAVQAFFNAALAYGDAEIPQSAYGCKLTDSITIADDNAGGNKRGVVIKSAIEVTSMSTGSTLFYFAPNEPNGRVGSITAAGNGGSGNVMATLTLGTNLGRAVLKADEAKWVGRRIEVWNCATTANNVKRGYITSVVSDGVVTFENSAAVATDYGVGGGLGTEKIHWRISMSAIRVLARDVELRGITVQPLAGSRFSGAAIELSVPTGVGAQTVINQRLVGCGASSPNIYTSRYSFGVLVAPDVVIIDPLAPNYHANAAGVPHVYNPPQVDTVRIERCHWLFAEVSCIEHIGTTGQSKECVAYDCSYGFAPYGYHSPADGGRGHMDHIKFSFGSIRDTCLAYGAQSSVTPRIKDGYAESLIGRFYTDKCGGFTNPVALRDCDMILSTGHASGEIIKTEGMGPLSIHGGHVLWGDNKPLHVIVGGLATEECKVSIRDWSVKGTTNYTGRRARNSNGIHGPWVFAGTEQLVISIDGAANVTITFSQANMNTACRVIMGGSYVVDLNEVHAWEVGQTIHYYLAAAGSNGVAWGDWDDLGTKSGSAWLNIFVESTTAVTGTVKFVSDTTPCSFNFIGSALGGKVRTQISYDTGGLVDHYSTTNTLEPVGAHLNFEGNQMVGFSSDVAVALEDLRGRRYGPRTKGSARLQAAGDLFTAAAGTTTGGRAVAVAGAVITISDTRVTANTVVHFVPTNAAALTLGPLYQSAVTANTSFALTAAGAPAGTETYRYYLVEAA